MVLGVPRRLVEQENREVAGPSALGVQRQGFNQGKPRHIGYFVDEVAAARAYDAKAAELQALDQGTDPSFNFPAEWEWERDWVVGGFVHLEEGSTGAWRRVGT